MIEKGIGETNLTVTIEGRRRFPVRVRYAPQFRSSAEAIGADSDHRSNRRADSAGAARGAFEQSRGQR